MRKAFAQHLEMLMQANDRIVLLTGDLGFQAFESIQSKFQSRFLNAGIAEQNMMGVAAGLAAKGFIPFVYSIAPFVVYRCLEQIRNDICFQNLPVIIVGNGGGYGYGIMGKTHHALEDYGILSSIGVHCVTPMINTDISSAVDYLIQVNKPSYLRLGQGAISESTPIPFSPWRKFINGSNATIVSYGALGANIYCELVKSDMGVDYWNCAVMPIPFIPDALLESIRTTKILLIVEEHSMLGGFGEHFIAQLHKMGTVDFTVKHLYALGYPHNQFGSQAFHQAQSEIDPISVINHILELIN